MLWTDASYHRPGDPGDIPYPGPSFADTINAIRALGQGKVLAIVSADGLTGSSNSQGNSEAISAADTLFDLEMIVSATGGLAPSGGVDCNGDGTIDIAPEQPLICNIGSDGTGIEEATIALVEAGTTSNASSTYLPLILND